METCGSSLKSGGYSLDLCGNGMKLPRELEICRRFTETGRGQMALGYTTHPYGLSQRLQVTVGSNDFVLEESNITGIRYTDHPLWHFK